jgi:hypothetical protein
MKTTAYLLVLGMVMMYSGLTASAGDKSKSEERSITGCLSQGDSASEFNLTANDGSTWELRSAGPALAPHVGHTVTVNGLVSHNKMHNMKEDTKDAAKDSGMTKSDNEHGHLRVTDVKMVSDSCSAK